jgi:hypothetical protein
MARRRRVDPTDEWQQVQLLAPWPAQVLDEALRPVVLFGQSPAERARQTGIAQRSLYRLAERFDQEGMRSLFPLRRSRSIAASPRTCATSSALSRPLIR